MRRDKLEVVYDFGKEVIIQARDITIREDFEIVDGTSKAPSDIALHNELGTLSDSQKNTIKKLLVNSIDGAINNLLWMMEEHNDQYAFVAKCDDGTQFDIEQESDGLCIGQYEFVDRFSKYNSILDILETGKLEKEATKR